MRMFTDAPALRVVALTAVVLLGACSKKDDATPTPTTYAATWTADNTNYTATVSQAQILNGLLSINLQNYVSSSNSNSVSLIAPPATGSYTVDGNPVNKSNHANYSTNINGTATGYFGTTGTITVTTFSATEVIGTFSYQAVNTTTPNAPTVTLTNGKFAIKR